MALKTGTILKPMGDELVLLVRGLSDGINTIGVDRGPRTVSQESEAGVRVYVMTVTFRHVETDETNMSDKTHRQPGPATCSASQPASLLVLDCLWGVSAGWSKPACLPQNRKSGGGVQYCLWLWRRKLQSKGAHRRRSLPSGPSAGGASGHLFSALSSVPWDRVQRTVEHHLPPPFYLFSCLLGKEPGKQWFFSHWGNQVLITETIQRP